MSMRLIQGRVRALVEHLAHGEYREVLTSCSSARLTAEELRRVVREYGRTVAIPPPDAYENLDAIQIPAASRQAWSVRAPLWTLEEGRSDLTLELTFIVDADQLSVELDDLHVL